VNRGPHGPGTWLAFPVDGVTGPLEEVYLWVIEEDYGVPFHAHRRALPPRPDVEVEEDLDAGRPRDGGPLTDGGVLRSYVFTSPLPIVRAGVFHLAVGNSEGPLTRPVEVEVVVSEVPIARQEAADALALGLTGIGEDISTLLHDDDPEWQAMLGEEGVTATVGDFDAATSDVAALAAISRDQYMALPTDIEPGVRELLWRSGMLESLATRASGITTLRFGGQLESAVVRSPFQALLFTLDTLSALLSTLALVADVVTVVLAVVTLPAGGEGALVGMAAKVVCAFFRAVVDTFLPTDPVEIFEIQSSGVVFETEGSMVAPWARWAPQNLRVGSVFRSLLEVVTIVVSEAIPGPGQPGARAALRRFAEFILTSVPGLAIDGVLAGMPPHIELALPLDMGFYNITLSQIVVLNPVFLPLAPAIHLIYDPELVSPYDVVARTSGARATANYDTRSVGVTDIVYATAAPSEQVGAIVRVRAFGFGTDGASVGGAQIIQFPFPYTIDASTRFMRVQQAPDPANPSQRISDEDFIMLDVNLVGGGTSRIVRPSTTSLRVYPLVLDDLAGGRPDVTQVDILVGGFPQYSGFILPDGNPVQVPLMLFPGLNEIRIVSTAGHSIGCGPAGADDICLEIELPEADNLNHRVVLYGDVGAIRDFRIWTPPLFPME
jgi:hypothetical protein